MESRRRRKNGFRGQETYQQKGEICDFFNRGFYQGYFR